MGGMNTMITSALKRNKWALFMIFGFIFTSNINCIFILC